MQTGEIQRRFGVPHRIIQYTLDTYPPPGLKLCGGQGHHLDLTPGQAFWVVLILNLKEAGFRVNHAAECAEFARRGFEILKPFSTDTFQPFDGVLEAGFSWYLEIGDGLYVRFLSDAEPPEPWEKTEDWLILRGHRLHHYPWFRLGRPLRPAGEITEPTNIMRVNLVAVASILSSG